MKSAPPQTWDIFCTVVDNYGDIGVCWRLARQLASEYPFTVRLWVDDLASFACIQPEIDPVRDEQYCAGVIVRHWPTQFPNVQPADVVIETFACHLPPCYVDTMRSTQPLWINLEYLSAEDWVEGCHQLASPQPGLQKYWYFPGFTERTGGVIGEAAMRSALEKWCRQDRVEYLSRFVQIDPAALVISLFAYENPAIFGLLTCWINGDQPIHALLPEGRLLPQVQNALGLPDLRSGQSVQRGALILTCFPMLPQAEYDRLLWSCDLNFVRGEDSFVRAQWAALPFVWHIYPQEENAHHVKLDAFMDRYCEQLDAVSAQSLRNFWWAWNKGEGADNAWPAFAAAFPALQDHAKVWVNRLAANGDLASNLVKFVLGKVE